MRFNSWIHGPGILSAHCRPNHGTHDHPLAVITTQMGIGHETRLKIICVFPGKIQGD